MRDAGTHRLGVALTAALGLHLALFAALALKPRALVSAPTPADAGLELAIELDTTPAEPAASSGTSDDGESRAAAEPSEPAAAARAAPERVPSRPLTPVEPPSEPEPAPAEVAAAEPSPQLNAPAPVAETAPPRLGLAELGIGHALSADVLGAAAQAGSGPAPSTLLRADTSSARPSADGDSVKERGEARLEHSLRSDLARRDQKRGLGPEGPVVLALERLVYEDATTAPNGEASVRVRLDGNGKLTTVELLSASSDTATWQRILELLRKELEKEPLPRVPARGASIEIKLVSREQLPSGASPGLAVDVLGIPVSRGRGPNPTRLGFLTPTIIEVPIPGESETIPLPVFSLVFGMGDPVDIGARPRRVVRARVTKYEVY